MPRSVGSPPPSCRCFFSLAQGGHRPAYTPRHAEKNCPTVVILRLVSRRCAGSGRLRLRAIGQRPRGKRAHDQRGICPQRVRRGPGRRECTDAEQPHRCAAAWLLGRAKLWRAQVRLPHRRHPPPLWRRRLCRDAVRVQQRRRLSRRLRLRAVQAGRSLPLLVRHWPVPAQDLRRRPRLRLSQRRLPERSLRSQDLSQQPKLSRLLRRGGMLEQARLVSRHLASPPSIGRSPHRSLR